MLILIVYLYAIILCGSINIGPISIRVIATCAMMIYLIVSKAKKKNYQRIDKSYIWLYLVFSIIMGLMLLINGEFSEFEFVKKFLAYNLVAIISFISIEVFVITPKQLKIVILSLLVLILVNNVITILQYQGNPFGWAVGYLFADIDKLVERSSEHDSLLGMSITPGIFGDVVKNAFYISVLTPLSLCFINEKPKFIYSLFISIIICSSFVAVFMTQQRSAFAILILMAIAWVFIFLRKHPIASICIVLSILLFALVTFADFSVPNNADLGRLAETGDNEREKLKIQAIDYILANPIVGGPVAFIKKTGLSAHNLILDSYIYAGIFGFIIMMILYAKTIWLSFGIIRKEILRSNISYAIIFFAVSVLSAMLYGLFHNTSYLSGEVIIFILLSLLLKIQIFNKKTNPSNFKYTAK